MNSTRPLALLVEDEREIRRFMRAALEAEGWRVAEADTAATGLREAAAQGPELVLLDLGLPDLDGVEFVRDLRGWSQCPVIIVSARSQERDKVRALDAGADDYLAKPFGVAELLARVRALRRRQARGPDAASALAFGDVGVDLAARRVTRAGAVVHLTPIEYRLLVALATHPGKVLTHRHLLREVWGEGYAESAHYLRIYVGRLRQKLEPDPAQPRHFLTETGVGYRFQP